MTDIIQLIKDYAEDFWPTNNLYEVGQLVYVLRSNGDIELAERLENWKNGMENRIHAEFSSASVGKAD